MPKYRVTVNVCTSHTVGYFIEADDECQAIDKAERGDVVCDGEYGEEFEDVDPISVEELQDWPEHVQWYERRKTKG